MPQPCHHHCLLRPPAAVIRPDIHAVMAVNRPHHRGTAQQQLLLLLLQLLLLPLLLCLYPTATAAGLVPHVHAVVAGQAAHSTTTSTAGMMTNDNVGASVRLVVIHVVVVIVVGSVGAEGDGLADGAESWWAGCLSGDCGCELLLLLVPLLSPQLQQRLARPVVAVGALSHICSVYIIFLEFDKLYFFSTTVQ